MDYMANCLAPDTDDDCDDDPDVDCDDDSDDDTANKQDEKSVSDGATANYVAVGSLAVVAATFAF